ncbi:DUF2325 domain-containing protein [Bacillus cihuensis]|uniref:DUF2325 domain-containing protein n=1 Tax=Bacillus cihuensis TaxID=1208599 RepID=UPI0003F4E7EC|nr:DUF2325 domain-containing protein [Bacillus cihuensis]
MKKTTLAIIGGSQKQTFEKIGAKHGCAVLFHDGKIRNGAVKKDFSPIVKKADCVVVLLGACGHVTMDVIKELCKEKNTPVVYHQGRGGSGAINSGLNLLNSRIAA